MLHMLSTLMHVFVIIVIACSNLLCCTCTWVCRAEYLYHVEYFNSAFCTFTTTQSCRLYTALYHTVSALLYTYSNVIYLLVNQLGLIGNRNLPLIYPTRGLRGITE